MRDLAVLLALIAFLPACNTAREQDIGDDYHSAAYERSMEEWGRSARWRRRAKFNEDRRKDDRR